MSAPVLFLGCQAALTAFVIMTLVLLGQHQCHDHERLADPIGMATHRR
jgi:hypothetical protein